MNQTSDPDQSNLPPERGLQVPSRAPVDTEREAAAHIVRHQLNTIYEHNPPNQTASAASPYDQTLGPSGPSDWQQYHTAWQQYYQQYYYRYFLHQQYAERKRQTIAAAEQAAAVPTAEMAPTDQVQQLKADLIDKVKERAKRARASHHFVPIVSALGVIAVFTFLQYNRVVMAQISAYVSPGTTISSSDTVLVDPTANANVGPEPRLIIPKINVDVPVVYDVSSTDDAPVQAALTRGVVHYNLTGASSLPGQVGNTVILGHSSNDVFDTGGFKFAFVLLDRLQPGDIFYLHYNGKRYIYRVSSTRIINPDQVNVLQVGTGKPIATLVTCTPAGTALQRLLVFADQVSPDPSAAAPAVSANAQSKQSGPIPGNSPTLLDRVFGLFH